MKQLRKLTNSVQELLPSRYRTLRKSFLHKHGNEDDFQDALEYCLRFPESHDVRFLGYRSRTVKQRRRETGAPVRLDTCIDIVGGKDAEEWIAGAELTGEDRVIVGEVLAHTDADEREVILSDDIDLNAKQRTKKRQVLARVRERLGA